MQFSTHTTRSRPRPRGFTLTEMLVVISVIIVLAGVLLAALATVKSSGDMTRSMSRLRQIATWTQLYAVDNRETVLPSQFDYSANPSPGRVRSDPDPQLGEVHKGTWTDILWTIHEVGVFPEAEAALNNDYKFDSPDQALYEAVGEFANNPFRSSAGNTMNTPDVPADSEPTPFGVGAQEAGEPGYFAMNDFFDARPNPQQPAGRWWVSGQIKAPDRSLYIIDSFAGEVIDAVGLNSASVQADFRYSDLCLMLFLDGHVSPEGPWEDLVDLQENRRIRVQNLHRN